MPLQDVYIQQQKRLSESRANQSSSAEYINQMKSGLMTEAPIAPTSKETNTFLASVGAANREENNKAFDEWQKYRQQKATYDSQSTQRAAVSFWEDQRQSFEKANEDTLVDRQAQLDEIAQFKAQSLLSNRQIEQTLSEQNEKLNAQSEAAISKVEQSFAQMGRVADPYVLGTIKNRLAMSNRDALNTTRTQLEIERAQVYSTYLGHLENTLANTKRSVMDPQTALSFMSAMGSSAAGSGGGISSSSGGGSGGNRSRSGGSGNSDKKNSNSGFGTGFTQMERDARAAAGNLVFEHATEAAFASTDRAEAEQRAAQNPAMSGGDEWMNQVDWAGDSAGESYDNYDDYV